MFRACLLCFLSVIALGRSLQAIPSTTKVDQQKCFQDLSLAFVTEFALPKGRDTNPTKVAIGECITSMDSILPTLGKFLFDQLESKSEKPKNMLNIMKFIGVTAKDITVQILKCEGLDKSNDTVHVILKTLNFLEYDWYEFANILFKVIQDHGKLEKFFKEVGQKVKTGDCTEAGEMAGLKLNEIVAEDNRLTDFMEKNLKMSGKVLVKTGKQYVQWVEKDAAPAVAKVMTRAAKGTAKGFTTAAKATVKGATFVANETARGATVAANATAKGATIAAKTSVDGLVKASKAVGTGVTEAANETAKGATAAGKRVKHWYSHVTKSVWGVFGGK